MTASLRALFQQSPSRIEVRKEIARYERDHAAGAPLVLDLGGGLYRYGDLFRGYAALNADRATRPEIVADLAHLPIRDGSIRACLSVAVLEHVADPRRVLAEMARILAPGGAAFLWVPFVHEVHPYPADYWRFTAEGIATLARGAGLEPVTVSTETFRGVFWTLAHMYRFVFPPTSRHFRWKLAGFAALHVLHALDHWLPSARFYTGIACVARAAS